MIEIRPFDAPCGAEVRGVRFDRRLGDDVRLELLAALAAHKVLVLRGHELPGPEAFREFGLRLGPTDGEVVATPRKLALPFRQGSRTLSSAVHGLLRFDGRSCEEFLSLTGISR